MRVGPAYSPGFIRQPLGLVHVLGPWLALLVLASAFDRALRA